ncbi:MAG: sigma-54-dependent transcriptional regulator [Nitrospinota bacterium]
MVPKILVIDDEASHRMMLKAVLSDEGYAVRLAATGEDGLRAVEEEVFDLILLDIRMPGIGGIETLRRIRAISPTVPVLMMTAYGTVNSAVEAMKLGAYDYLEKPLDVEVLKITLRNVLEHQSLKVENRLLRERLARDFDYANIIGRSRALREVFKQVSLVAPTDATVLITGESGTGKELIAGAIHQNSRRKDRPFIKVTCAAIPETLLESELFGHEKGAYTGAISRQAGRFSLADGGTIFLDEIAEVPASIQVKLLRALQEKTFEPLGSGKTQKVDVRILAATNRDLESSVQSGTFREDLFYRLNVFPIRVPSLRERREDIPLLAEHFLKRFTEKNARPIRGFTPRAMDLLARYPWPGNVRELENCVERAVIVCRGDLIEPGHLPPAVRADAIEEEEAGLEPAKVGSGRKLRDMERELILRTLHANDGNRTRTAEILGISRRTLQMKVKQYEREGKLQED